MADEAHDISWEGLAESLSAEGLTAYLLDSRTANDAIERVVEETSAPKVLVRLAFKVLAGLVAARGKSALQWTSSVLESKALSVLEQAPGADKLKRFIWSWSRTLRENAARREALDAIINGSTAQVDPELAKGFSESTRLALRMLDRQGEYDAGQQQIIGDLSTVRGQLETIRERLNPQPPLDDRMLSSNEANRLAFGARRVPFVGRDAEMAALKAFLNADANDGQAAPFRWWLALGAGGLGKSRLALEFCLQAGMHWQTGFLASTDTQFDWDNWQPELPTLIIIDYAGTRPKRTGDILRSLARRAGRQELAAPVRVLLMERNRDDLWWNRMRGGGSEAYTLDAWRHAEQDLELRPLDDDAAWAIVETIFDEQSTPVPDRAETLQRIREIDPALRPLFVTLASESLAEREDLRGWDRERLLQDVLKRDELKFWPKNIDTTPYANLLCLATMVGGLNVKMLKHPPEGIALPAFETFNPQHYRAMARAVSEPEDGDMLPPLLPDIIGEYFVLQHLTGTGTPAQQKDRIVSFRDAAWGMEGVDLAALWSHLDRQTLDFPEDVPLALLDAPQIDSAEVQWLWGAIVANAVLRLGDARLLLDKLRDVAEANAAQPAIRHEWSRGAVNLISRLAQSGEDGLKDANIIVDSLRQMADAHPTELDIRLAWARGTFNLINGLTQSDKNHINKARTLLASLRETVKIYPSHHKIRFEWAKSTFNLITILARYGGEQLQEALTLADDIRNLTDTDLEDSELRIVWARSVVNLINGLIKSGENNVGEALSRLSALQDVADTYPETVEIRVKWANGAVNLIEPIAHSGANGAGEARMILDCVNSAANEHPNQTEIRIAWATGAFNLITTIAKSGKGGFDVARDTLNIMRKVSITNPGRPEIRLEWARAVCNFIDGLILFGSKLDSEAEGLVNELWEMLDRSKDNALIEPAMRASARIAKCHLCARDYSKALPYLAPIIVFRGDGLVREWLNKFLPPEDIATVIAAAETYIEQQRL